MNPDQLLRYWEDVLSPEYYPEEEAKERAAMIHEGMAGMGSLASKKIPTHREILEAKRVAAQAELEKIDDAIKALDEHPEVVMVLDKLAKVLRRL